MDTNQRILDAVTRVNLSFGKRASGDRRRFARRPGCTVRPFARGADAGTLERRRLLTETLGDRTTGVEICRRESTRIDCVVTNGLARGLVENFQVETQEEGPEAQGHLVHDGQWLVEKGFSRRRGRCVHCVTVWTRIWELAKVALSCPMALEMQCQGMNGPW